ncbi:proline-rich protein 4 isoform X1 [Tripterygium wilfordii]|uniref:Proline-rich protein 4 isoform X1 n=1 Tax=Tripterygium wilfordii TaxID=458696 RepID=A0A7J7C156_TRIWF|nr:proline-rich protein 4-like [Tripterygium wilfordii]KAF5727838.1 proline-rich protein 4 isoform X1 [Tripterygium wilfordii]
MRILPALLCLFFAASFCYADNTVEVVGIAECADCAQNNIKASQALSGLHVTIDCKAENAENYERRGVGQLSEEGKFTVSLPQELLKDGKLKEECYAQLHSASAAPCAAHDGLESTKIVFKSKTNDKHTFGVAGKLKISPMTCTSAFLWPHFKYPPLHKFPKFKHPIFKGFGHHYSFPPLPPKVYPPIYHKPLPPPIPIYKPKPHPVPIPIYKPKPHPVPIPIYKPKPHPVPVPIYKPKPHPVPVPIYKPKPHPVPVPIYKPKPHPVPVPIYKPKPHPVPVPIYKPKPPIYKPPVVLPPPVPIYKPKPPIYKPPVVLPPPVPIYKPKPPIYKPPVVLPPPVPVYKPPVVLPPPVPIYKPKPPIYHKPLPPFPTIPPYKKKPCPPLPKLPPFPKIPPKPYFHHPHPKIGKFLPPLPPYSPIH